MPAFFPRQNNFLLISDLSNTKKIMRKKSDVNLIQFFIQNLSKIIILWPAVFFLRAEQILSLMSFSQDLSSFRAFASQSGHHQQWLGQNRNRQHICGLFLSK